MIVETPSKLKSSISIFLNYFYGFQLDLNFCIVSWLSHDWIKLLEIEIEAFWFVFDRKIRSFYFC